MIFILVCKLGEKEINCYDGMYDRNTLKAWSRKGILRCPQCGEQYTYNHGKVRTPYFKHLNSDCVMYGEPETEEHIQGKIDLYEWVKKQDGVTDVKLEGWLPDTKQRPDIMFKYNGKQYVIEFQCSQISSEYIERHELYQAAGIHDIWICGAENYMQWYHDGDGVKRENYLESICQRYYDSKLKKFFFYESLIPEVSMIQKRYIRFSQIKEIPYVYHDECVMQRKHNVYAYKRDDVQFLNNKFVFSYDSLSYYKNQYVELQYDVNNLINKIMNGCIDKYKDHISYNYISNTIDVVDLHGFEKRRRFNIPIDYIEGTIRCNNMVYPIKKCGKFVNDMSDAINLFAEDVVKQFENIDLIEQVENIPNKIQYCINQYKNCSHLFNYCELMNFKFDSTNIYSFKIKINLNNDCFIKMNVQSKTNKNIIDVFVAREGTPSKKLKHESMYYKKIEFVTDGIERCIDTIICELQIIFRYIFAINDVFNRISSLSNKNWKISYNENFNRCRISLRALCMGSHGFDGLKCIDVNIEDYFTIEDYKNGYNMNEFELALKQKLKCELFNFVIKHPFLKFKNKGVY